MRMVRLRTRRLMVERTLNEVEGGGLSVRKKAMVLKDLAATSRLLHRWDREAVEEKRERMWTRQAINPALMAVPPEQLSGD